MESIIIPTVTTQKYLMFDEMVNLKVSRMICEVEDLLIMRKEHMGDHSWIEEEH